ncbi:hypothetical protein [Hydrogenovibrio halophilus]|uniref:hypothetical protein n=1 Tax=Hydrogenovibrio halophilus TaxID=373391 RepID=UPI000376A5D5|nr:hypothetical protein [Hydrogenovibrio halophilus]
MVKAFWRDGWLGLSLGVMLSLFAPMASALLVQSEFSQREIQMGEGVNWVLSGPDVQTEAFNQAWSKMDWAPIQAHFYIEGIRQRGTGLSVRLIPYRSGEIQLPQAKDATIPMPEQPLWVAENPAIGVDWTPPEETVYAGQVISWQVEMDAADDGWTAQLRPPEAALSSQTPREKGWVLPQDAADLPSVVTQANSLTRLRLGREMRSPLETKQPDQANQSGERAVLAGPLLVVRNESARNWVFAAPPVALNIQALPGFLPWQMPVGRLQLQAESLPWLVTDGALYHWTLRLTGRDLAQNRLPDLSRQMQGHSAIEWLSAKTRVSQTWTQKGLISEAEMTQPLRIKGFGPVRLPEVTVNALNPQTGKLQTSVLSPQTVWVLPGWLVWTLYAVSLLLALWALGWLWQALNGIWARAQLRWRLRRAGQALHPQVAVWQAVQAWSKSQLPGWDEREAPSPKQWLQAFEARFGASPEARAWVSCFNQCRYAHPEDAPVACDALIKTCQAWSKRVPLRRTRR